MARKLCGFEVLFVGLAVLAAGCSGTVPAAGPQGPTVAGEAGDDPRLAAFFEEAFQLRVSRSPMFQTMLGIKTDYDKWDDISEERTREDHDLMTTYLARLRHEFDFQKLKPKSQLSYRLFEFQLEQQLAGFRWRHHNYAATQMFGLHEWATTLLINFHRIDSVADAQAYVARLRAIRPLLSQLEDRLRTGEKKGVLPPKFVFPKVLDVSRNVISGRPFDKSDQDAPLWADFKRKVEALKDTTAERKTALLADAEEALVTSVKPAYQSLMAVFRRQEKLAITDDGVWKLPDGGAYYDHRLAEVTTTKKSADEIHEIGLREVARIHGEIRQIMKKTKFKGNMKEFFTFMRTDPQFFYKDNDAGRAAYLAKVEKTLANVRARLDELFITKPKAGLVVKRVEAYREKSSAAAFYNRPAPDGSRPGIYYENLSNMKAKPIYEIEALVFHEGIPGHHMQIAIAQELKHLPKFRRFGGYTAYIEGWGLYSEFVPKEIGLYPDAYADFGRLSMELWRAGRLVVDTAIHNRRWTRQQAIDYLLENTPNPKHDVIREVERYIVLPGQATGYKIGMLKILELRERAKAQLGAAFDIRQFHDTVLSSGPVPLDLLDELVTEWIATAAATK